MVTSVFGDSDSSSHYHMGSIPCEMLTEEKPAGQYIIGAGATRLCPLGFFVCGKTREGAWKDAPTWGPGGPGEPSEP